MRQVECAGGIIVSPERQILVVVNTIGSVTFPKGTIEEGEDERTAAEREILQESGLKRVELHQKLGSYMRKGYTADNATTPSVIKHIHMFYGTTDNSELGVPLADVKKAVWADSIEVSRLLTHPADVSFFEEHRAEIGL